MISLLRQVLDRGLEINERLAAAAANGFDWLFRHEHLSNPDKRNLIWCMLAIR